MNYISEEDRLLRALIIDVNSSSTLFKLAPTYTCYMAVRYCISGGYRPDMPPHDRARRVTALVDKISRYIHQAVQVCKTVFEGFVSQWPSFLFRIRQT